MVSQDTRDLILILIITWGKEMHLSNKRFIAVCSFCIKNMRQHSDRSQNTIMRVRKYKRFIAKIVSTRFDKLFCYDVVNYVIIRKYTSKRIFRSSPSKPKIYVNTNPYIPRMLSSISQHTYATEKKNKQHAPYYKTLSSKRCINRLVAAYQMPG